MNFAQTVFTIFYAIFWSATASVHPRWRMFDWPQAKLHDRIDNRVKRACLILNVAPFFYFWLAITLTSCVDDPVGDGWFRYFLPLVAGIAPALAALGFYRFFLSTVGKSPDRYYWRDDDLTKLKTQLPLETSIKDLGLEQPGWEINRRVALKQIFGPLAVIALVLALQSWKPSPSRRVIGQHEQHHASAKQAIANDGDKPPQAAASVPDPQSKVDSNKHGNQRDESKDPTPQDRWGTVPDWIVAIAALAALGIYGTQTWHMSRANKASDAIIERMRLEQRPWVAVTKVEKDIWEDRTPLHTRIVVKNTGNSPAFIYRKVARIFERPRFRLDLTAEAEAVDDELAVSEDAYEVVRAPGSDEHTFKNFHSECEINLLLSERIQNPGLDQTALFFIAAIAYRDADGRTYRTRCCYKWNVSEKKFMGHRLHNIMT